MLMRAARDRSYLHLGGATDMPDPRGFGFEGLFVLSRNVSIYMGLLHFTGRSLS
jgi:hypothetical protein